MISELASKNFKNMKPLIARLGLENHPVINGVVDGNNAGHIYVDDIEKPSTAVVWAQMEMFYFLGDSDQLAFIKMLEHYILEKIKPLAIEMGDFDFNLEMYPFEKWEKTIQAYFKVNFHKGKRVPFLFKSEKFLEMLEKPFQLASGYELLRIDDKVLEADKERILQLEILKFWESIDMFLRVGLGYCVLKDTEIIGSCISVFVSGKEFEIGINTYSSEHRGKGLATAMAREFILECLKNQKTPHWTTEEFRKDSVAIAEKLGFMTLPLYSVYYIPFRDWDNN
jgi:RimJ/RimL family protein N-acetyltransferase